MQRRSFGGKKPGCRINLKIKVGCGTGKYSYEVKLISQAREKTVEIRLNGVDGHLSLLSACCLFRIKFIITTDNNDGASTCRGLWA